MITALSILRLIPKNYYEANIVQNGKVIANGLIKHIMESYNLNLGDAVKEIYPITDKSIEIILE